MAIVVLAAGCGENATQAWDKNHDGLVSQCEGLGQVACSVTPGCEGQNLACAAICQDDGKGGCLPCPKNFQCVPKPAPACKDLNPQQCASDPRCVADNISTTQNNQICTLECRDDGKGGCVPCNSVPTCRDRAPVPQTQCGQLPIGSCAIVPACTVQTMTVCTANATPPSAGCFGGGGGGGCSTTQICVNKQAPLCDSTPISTCTANPSCKLELGPVCEIACQPGTNCPPCATGQQRCVTRATTCDSRSLAECTSAVGCTIETSVCAAICQPDGKGGCLPCVGQSRCIPLALPLPPQPTK